MYSCSSELCFGSKVRAVNQHLGGGVQLSLREDTFLIRSVPTQEVQRAYIRAHRDLAHLGERALM